MTSAAVAAANSQFIARVASGALTQAMPSMVADHCVKQNGQVSSSPIARRSPSPRGVSFTSAASPSSTHSVNGRAHEARDLVLGDQSAEPECAHSQQRAVAERRP
jgi:hypothetical protein